MKKIALILCLILSATAFAQKAQLTVNISFTGIVEGYDHLTKDEIYIDDILVMTTDEHLESEPHTVKLKVNKGEHTVRVVNWNKYEGVWEQKTKENQYSVDGFFTETFVFKKKNVLTILHDIDDPEHSPIVRFNE